MLTKGDKILIAFILLVAGLIFVSFSVYGFSAKKVYAVIKVDGELFQKVSLGKEGPKLKINVPGKLGETIVEIDMDRVRIVSSPCPDKDCEHQGWIKRQGQIIVCLPNRVVITIETTNPDQDVDAVSF